MDTSAKGRQAIHVHEGNPSTVYLDPAGFATVGPGLAAHNPIVKRELGRLKPGTTYGRSRLDRVFAMVLDEYVEPALDDGMPGAAQHEYDAGASVLYNLGTGAIDWNWADLWRAGRKEEAADYLASHYNTAGGKRFKGLVRRRKAEAKLLEHGIYPQEVDGEGTERNRKWTSGPDPVVRDAQEMLTKEGFDPGVTDGWMGPNTEKAVLAYQRAHPHLKNDGILGPATLAQLRRDSKAVKEVVSETLKKGGGGSVATGAAAFFAGLPWPWIIGAVVVGVLAWVLWKNRDVFTRRWNSLTGKTVEV